jgi:two-component system chemotaxis response regulator CheB
MEQIEPIQVLVCDDSALMRNLISRIVDSTNGLHTAGIAMNGQFCLDKIPMLHPDVIVLDIEMPVMTGVQFLQKRKELGIEIPVIILSSIATKGAAVTMQCLELGAADFITKPNGSVSSDISTVANHLVELLSSYGGAYARLKGKTVYPPDFFLQQVKLHEAEQAAAKEGILDKVKPGVTESTLTSSWVQPPVHKQVATITPLRAGGPIEVIAIGISTGGPNALREVFAKIDPQLKQPILVVQHMPAGFTKEFAASLDRICPLDVKEAEEGDLVKPGRILIAPGDFHIYVEKKSLAIVVHLSQDDLRNGHRPSADVLFESVAKVYENRALGVIMTGMGRDGALKLAEMRRQGAWTLGQDEKSSIVYGMPKVAWELGAVQKQVPLDQMAAEISELARLHLN